MTVLLLRDEAGPAYAAAVVFCAGALTDVIDGYLARARDTVTRFGRIMDPLADKLLVGAALTTLVVVDRLVLWFAVVVIAREVAVSLLRWYAGTRNAVIAVSAIGKAKTGAQMATIIALMLVPDPGAGWVDGLLVGVAVLTAASGVDYFLAYARVAAAPPAVAAARGSAVS